MPNRIPTVNETALVMPTICQDICGAKGVMSEMTKAPI